MDSVRDLCRRHWSAWLVTNCILNSFNRQKEKEDYDDSIELEIVFSHISLTLDHTTDVDTEDSTCLFMSY